MKFYLKNFAIPLNEKDQTVILYVDFNVLNLVYEKKIFLPSSFNLYYDSSLLYFCLKILGYKSITKNISTDYQEQFLEKNINEGKRLFFFGDREKTLIRLKENLRERFPNIKIVGVFSGYNYNSETVISFINSTNCDILFVGLGAGRQEKWILENYSKINTDVILSVGGWFKYLAGKKSRAPLSLRKLHLEWFYKLLTEFPRVWHRYLWGAPKFLYRVFISKKIQLKLDEM